MEVVSHIIQVLFYFGLSSEEMAPVRVGSEGVTVQVARDVTGTVGVGVVVPGGEGGRGWGRDGDNNNSEKQQQQN